MTEAVFVDLLMGIIQFAASSRSRMPPGVCYVHTLRCCGLSKEEIGTQTCDESRRSRRSFQAVVTRLKIRVGIER